jgi:hypothetical protein
VTLESNIAELTVSIDFDHVYEASRNRPWLKRARA